MMGSGKSSTMMKYVDSNPEHNYIYITPFLSEVQRVKNCTSTHFMEPVNLGAGKQKSLKHLLADGCNVVATHSLFLGADSEIEELLQTGDYILILDEVLDVLQPFNQVFPSSKVKKGDIALMLQKNMIKVDEYGLVRWTDYGNYSDFVYNEVELLAKAGNLVCVDDALFLCRFNPNIFSMFSSVYILTYQFSGSILRAYFDFYGIPYTRRSIKKDGENYCISEYADDSFERQRIRSLVNVITDDKLNEIGARTNALSKSWYRNADSERKKVIKNNISNLLKNKLGSVSSDRVMWTCFKDDYSFLVGQGYKYIRRLKKEDNSLSEQDRARLKCFVPCNARASNDYADRDVLFYLLNRYPDPEICKFFGRKGIELDRDQYALNEMLQWIWRSAIRNGKHIDIYIPSRRMRQLLIDWLDGK